MIVVKFYQGSLILYITSAGCILSRCLLGLYTWKIFIYQSFVFLGGNTIYVSALLQCHFLLRWKSLDQEHMRSWTMKDLQNIICHQVYLYQIHHDGHLAEILRKTIQALPRIDQKGSANKVLFITQLTNGYRNNTLVVSIFPNTLNS